MIKLAKEKLDDATHLLSTEQLLAREHIIKTVNAYNQSQFIRQIHLNNSSKNEQSKSLLCDLFSQLSYNELKKQKINQSKLEIWDKFVQDSVQNARDDEKHVNNLCNKYKIVL
jgi:hypothetical protein